LVVHLKLKVLFYNAVFANLAFKTVEQFLHQTSWPSARLVTNTIPNVSRETIDLLSASPRRSNVINANGVQDPLKIIVIIKIDFYFVYLFPGFDLYLSS